MGSARAPWLEHGEPVVAGGVVRCRGRGVPLGSVVKVPARSLSLRLDALWLAYPPGDLDEGQPFRLRREAARWLLERSLLVSP